MYGVSIILSNLNKSNAFHKSKSNILIRILGGGGGKFFFVKGTVSVILSDLLIKDGNTPIYNGTFKTFFLINKKAIVTFQG